MSQSQATTLPPSEISSLTDSQERTLSSLSVVSSCLSILGSSMIVYLVVKNSRKTPYKRILLGLSVSDIIASTTWLLTPFLLPADSSQRVWARGVDATCTSLGFLTQLSHIAVWYNGMLSYYYLLTVRFRVRGITFASRYEPWIHISSIGFNLVAGIVGVSKGYYAEIELGQGCYIAEYPEGCETNGSCTGHIIGWIVSGGPVVFLFLSILVNNATIYCYVRRTTQRSINKSIQGRNTQNGRIKAVATQAILYVGTFLVAYVWYFAIRVAESMGVQAADEARIYPVLVLSSIFLPLQGVFNLFVYSRPNYLRMRQSFPNDTRRFAMRRAWFGGTSNHNPNTSVDGTLWSRRMAASLRIEGGVPDVEKVRLRVSQQFSATFSGKDPLRRDIRIREPLDLASVKEQTDRTNTAHGEEQHTVSWNQEQSPSGQHSQDQPPSSSSDQEHAGVLGLMNSNTPTSLVMQDDGTSDLPENCEEQEDGVEPTTPTVVAGSSGLDFGVPSPPTESELYPVPQEVSMAMEEDEDPDELMIEDFPPANRVLSSTVGTVIQLDDSNR